MPAVAQTETGTTGAWARDAVGRHSRLVGLALTAPLAYRRLTRVGPRRARPALIAAALLGTHGLVQFGQRVAVLHGAVPLDAEDHPAWHRPGLLPLMVADEDHAPAAGATLGRTRSGPVVVFDARLLATGTVSAQLAAYTRAAATEPLTRAGGAAVVAAANLASWTLLRRVVLGDQRTRTPVSRRRAVAYLAADALVRPAVAATVTGAVKQAARRTPVPTHVP